MDHLNPSLNQIHPISSLSGFSGLFKEFRFLSLLLSNALRVLLLVFHRNLRDSKSPQISSILASILIDFYSDSSKDQLFSQSLFQVLEDLSKVSNRHFRVPQLFQFSCNVYIFVKISAFFYLFLGNSKIH